MTTQKLEEILQKGEGVNIEFKTSQFELNKDVFESICALLNRKGGHLLLGVNNRGEVEGVFDDCIQNMINQIITCANNPQKLNPIVYLSPEIIEYNGKKVIHILIPESSQVHATNGKIFDRNEDGDFNITGQSAQVNQLYLRKQDIYTENRLYPYVRLTDFKPQLFGRIRILAKNQRPNHPWFEMTNEELRKKFGESSEKISEFIENKPYMSAIDMAENIGITERAVEKNLAKLKANDIGPDKGGYWKIKPDDNGQ